jgi:hypothetical protein
MTLGSAGAFFGSGPSSFTGSTASGGQTTFPSRMRPVHDEFRPIDVDASQDPGDHLKGHGDFQTNIFKIENYFNFKQLILFQFFIVFLVSFGTIWKYLTLTGTIWAQSYTIRPFQKNNFISFQRLRSNIILCKISYNNKKFIFVFT